jgi:polyphosphate kinase 2 (PPK2 family)
MRAYGDISDFEQQTVKHNTVMVKFRQTITRDEQ